VKDVVVDRATVLFWGNNIVDPVVNGPRGQRGLGKVDCWLRNETQTRIDLSLVLKDEEC